MPYRQVSQPNLDPYVYANGKVLTDWLGWCLAYVRAVFSAPYAGGTAWESWTGMTKYKHNGRDIPSGVYVPIWFDHVGTYNGVYKHWGHVAVAYKHPTTGAINIWSSPVTHKPFADTWTSIEAVEAHYSSIYVGWSEDVGGKRIIEPIAVTTPQGGDMVTDKRQLDWMYDAVIGRARGAGEGEDVYLGKDSGFVFDDLYKAKERALRIAEKASTLANALAQSAAATSTANKLSVQVMEITQARDAALAKVKVLEEQESDIVPTPGLDTYSMGELLSAAFSKLFKIK